MTFLSHIFVRQSMIRPLPPSDTAGRHWPHCRRAGGGGGGEERGASVSGPDPRRPVAHDGMAHGGALRISWPQRCIDASGSWGTLTLAVSRVRTLS
jgi:hypothetical protein